MDDKLNEIAKHISEIKITLALNTQSLQEHMRRSEANEEAIQELRRNLEPVALHVAVVGALGKVLGIIGTVVGILFGVLKILGTLT